MSLRILLVGCLLSITAAVGTATSAEAAPAGSVQAQIDKQLREYPGGRQISATEVSYADGAFVISFARKGSTGLAGTLATNDCPSGTFCFYDQVAYGYPRGVLSACGWQDLANWGWQDHTESAVFNIATGSVSFINHGTKPDHSTDVTLWTLTTTKRTLIDVTPYRNMADHVYRTC